MQLRAFVFDGLASLRDLLSVALRDRGYEVVSAAEPLLCPLYGKENCCCPQEYPCGDLLIVDNDLPRMSGLEFVSRQRRSGCKGMVQNICVMSADWSPEELASVRQLGCKELKKPFRLKEFAAWLDSCETRVSVDRVLAPLPSNVVSQSCPLRDEGL